MKLKQLTRDERKQARELAAHVITEVESGDPHREADALLDHPELTIVPLAQEVVLLDEFRRRWLPVINEFYEHVDDIPSHLAEVFDRAIAEQEPDVEIANDGIVATYKICEACSKPLAVGDRVIVFEDAALHEGCGQVPT